MCLVIQTLQPRCPLLQIFPLCHLFHCCHRRVHSRRESPFGKLWVDRHPSECSHLPHWREERVWVGGLYLVLPVYSNDGGGEEEVRDLLAYFCCNRRILRFTLLWSIPWGRSQRVIWRNLFAHEIEPIPCSSHRGHTRTIFLIIPGYFWCIATEVKNWWFYIFTLLFYKAYLFTKYLICSSYLLLCHFL